MLHDSYGMNFQLIFLLIAVILLIDYIIVEMEVIEMRVSVPKKKVRDEVNDLLNNVYEENKKNLPMINHGEMPRPPHRAHTGGRLSKMTPSCVEEIIERVARGETVKTISADPHMPSAPTIWEWIRTKPEFSKLYYEAKRFQTDVFAEEILSIADDNTSDINIAFDKHGNLKPEVNFEVVKRSELRIKARQWLMERTNASKYHDKMMLEQAAAVQNAPKMNATIKIVLPDNGRPISATFETNAEEV